MGIHTVHTVSLLEYTYRPEYIYGKEKYLLFTSFLF
jgi:hypothetical protein